MSEHEELGLPTPPAGFRLVAIGEAYDGPDIRVMYDGEPWRVWSFPTLWPTDTVHLHDKHYPQFAVPTETP